MDSSAEPDIDMAADNTESPEGLKDVKRDQQALRPRVIYSVQDIPPLYLCLILGFQHYVTAVSGIISTPLMLRDHFCMDDDDVGVSELIGTILFVSGLATLLQSTIGIRLPIVQGSTITFVVPTLAIMSQPQWKCPYTEARKTYGQSVNFTDIGLPPVGSEGHREIWQSRVREIQGAIIIASIFQVVIGFFGIMTYAIKFIGPLSIIPIITLTGISLFPVGSKMSSGQWWIAVMTMLLITIFSQYMKDFKVWTFSCTADGCKRSGLNVFGLFPILLSMIISTIICSILTATNVLPDDKEKWGYLARTDTSLDVLSKSKWVNFPYPGQWGTPTISTVGVFGMLSGVLAAMVESVGDYFACARLSGAPPPPLHAVNRGIFIEGICCVLTGAWGSGNGTTSFSENIGVIGLTKVGSRRVVQIGGLMMLILGCFGKFAALFLIIPKPVLGGTFMVTFAMVTAVGLSNMQYIDLNSSRNLFVVGVPIFFGLSLSQWIAQNDSIKTGNTTVDQLFTVLLSTGMFVGGILGFILDNTVPGTDEERGLKTWRQNLSDKGEASDLEERKVYDLPFIGNHIRRVNCLKYLPISPTFVVNETGVTNKALVGNTNQAFDGKYDTTHL
ncbi:S23A2-like protein [Mya arenaria]|uniref:S23A2-like protein n=1 Tax=Mya arenaria TaxID=6604 RepID=A0ABY7F4J5_MYAAR|nr:solute carrier family 23 member 2-like [Mya arenaria]WAR17070.1 S23A2-like protein [Mya arenaria]